MFGNAIPTRCTAVIQIARTPDSLIAQGKSDVCKIRLFCLEGPFAYASVNWRGMGDPVICSGKVKVNDRYQLTGNAHNSNSHTNIIKNHFI